ncbi:MAG: sigma-70 family RNA polymerase sigma factor [Gemmataceae bacterium]|nr:sigma-70 family RNA polymerase sigma factor [Gemmataceae bacterium]
MHTTPASLLERLRQPGERAAWDRFVQLYTPFLYYWARRLGLQEPDASDLVQDVFILLLQKLPEFAYDQHKSFRNWLRTVLFNKWRENRRRATLPARQVDAAALARIVGPDNVEGLMEAEFQQYLAIRALQLMQDEFRPTTWKACWEHIVVGRPAVDVAQELEITVNAVYLATSRVLRRLRQELQGMLD